MSITVYKSEIEDGLAKAIQNCNSIAYESLAKKARPSKIEKASFSSANHGVNLQDEDLFFLDAILASVGLNSNDDYFLKEETWIARNSAVHKQFNYMHNQTDIIGHIFASNVFDINSKLIPDDSCFDDIPDFFDIVTSSVLYKAWPQEDLQIRMDKICEEISQGKWFVSMECLFRDFDYALSNNNVVNIIERKKETSFLTKHLRVFGGSGQYNGQKLSRVLRRYSFNGKGLVDNPANKRSIIFDNIERLKTYSIAFNGETKMDKEITPASELKAVDSVDFAAMLAKANEENDKLRKALEDKAQAELISAKDKFDAELASAVELAKSKDAEIEALKLQVSEALAQAKINKDKVDEVTSVLASLREENKKQERINKLVSAGVKDGVNDIVTKWSNTSDEQFNDIVALYSESAKTMKKEYEKEDESDKDESSEAAIQAIDESKVEKEDNSIALASNQNADDEEKRLMVSASSWLGSILKSTKKNKGE